MTTARTLTLLLAILAGAALGVGFFTFIYAQGSSYLTDNPAACANCHIMEDHFSAWLKSSHRHAAVCNDCHTPHGLVAKYTVKASNGFWHSFAFTTGWFPDRIEITNRNFEVTDAACRKCHQEIVEAIERADSDSLTCIRCHSTVGHLE
jgi:cytochrome c nitrite reductase small subunit